MSRTQWTWELVNAWFAEHGGTLVTNEYVNMHQKLEYVCDICGNVHYRSLDNVRSAGGVCDKRSLNGPSNKMSDEQVAEVFAERGCELISFYDYFHGSRRFKYRCSCGNVTLTTLKRLHQRVGCDRCYRWLRRKPFSEVEEAFDELNLDLLSTEDEYENNMSKLLCRCRKCGFTGETTYGYVQDGRHPCPCGYDGIRGENNYLYNPNITDEERKIRRNYAEYTHWRQQVYERDNFTCQICGARKKLNAHHLYNYAEYPELRLELTNAVTLCETCHSHKSEVGFHHFYGTRHNTPEQYYTYAKWRREQLGISGIGEEVDSLSQDVVANLPAI